MYVLAGCGMQSELCSCVVSSSQPSLLSTTSTVLTRKYDVTTFTHLLPHAAIYQLLTSSRSVVLQTVESVEKTLLWWGYWVGLGILSSVGLGTGLHTFLLYLVRLQNLTSVRTFCVRGAVY